ncbi:putative NRPS-like enzyme [Xylogone sp. PMI_703]|nr:putative NRPS-like enzyme [Xylogone sp. PMI_703]
MSSILPPEGDFRVANIDITNTAPGKDYVRTLPELIEFNSRHNANHLFCIQALKHAGNTYDLVRVSYDDLKQAILHCSKWLVSHITEIELPRSEGEKIVKGRPVALFVESDLNIVLYLFALLHLGVPVVLLSARLSPVAFHHLVTSTSAVVIITSKRQHRFVAQADTGLPVYQIAQFQELLSLSQKERLDGIIGSPHHYTTDTDRNAIILHSSGSTGLPKPIYQAHRYLLCFTRAHLFRSPEEAQALTLSTLPLYHGYGLITLGLSLGAGQAFCLPPSDIVPNAISTVDLIQMVGARSLMTVPSILEDIATSTDGNGSFVLSQLNYVAFGGGPLKVAVGDALAKDGVKLLNHYGATEVGPISPIFIPQKGYNWRYFRLRKDMDLVLTEVKSSDQGRQFSLTAHPFGWNAPFEIQDSLVEDPENPGVDFANVGRKDDVVILATGEKVNPQILEAMLENSSEVKTAVVFGENQFEIGVIVEPTPYASSQDEESLRHTFWAVIQKANQQMDAHARVSSPAAVIVIPPGRSLPRSDKGSIKRKEVYAALATDIEQVYRLLEEASGQSSIQLRMDSLEQDLKLLIKDGLGFAPPDKTLSTSDDFFELGMDSLQALRLRRLIVSSLPKAKDGDKPASEIIPRDFVYRNPSISHLVRSLRDGNAGKSTSELLESYLKQYSPYISHHDRSPLESPAVVLITGATGSLGSHLLAHLTSLPSVTRIICLNRLSKRNGVSDPYSRQRQSIVSRDILFSDNNWSKIEVIETDFGGDKLGLSGEDYVRISGQLTHIIHNAWPLNFSWTLESFQGQFKIVQNLIQLARDTYKTSKARRTRLVFLSSIAVVGRYQAVYGTRVIPEVSLDNGQSTNSFGYGQAKLVCENIVELAASSFPEELETVAVRIGQMSAARKTGFWSTTEHIAALVKSSQRVGAFPYLKGTCSWLPVDTTAEVLSDILLSAKLPSSPILHLENPVRQSWHDVSIILASSIGLQDSKFISYKEWIQRVISLGDGINADNPAYQLLEFFQNDFEHMASGNVIMDTSLSRRCSRTLRNADIVSEANIIACINYWKRIGFLKR